MKTSGAGIHDSAKWRVSVCMVPPVSRCYSMRPNALSPGKSWCSASSVAESRCRCGSPCGHARLPSDARPDGLATACRNRTGRRVAACLVGLQRQAIIAAAFGDRCNRAAIAMQRIGGHDLALERDQARNFDRRLQFATMVGGHRDQCRGPASDATGRHRPRPSSGSARPSS